MESIPENGVQRFGDIIIEQHSEDDAPMLHLELEDSDDTTIHEINMNQSIQIGVQETVPDLETSASQIVNDDIRYFTPFCLIRCSFERLCCEILFCISGSFEYGIGLYDHRRK